MENQKLFCVIDSSVTNDHPKRVHEVMVNGVLQRVEFNLGAETLLPYEVAVKFTQDGFRVFEKDSTVEIKAPPKTDETVRIRIKDDEVVAKYDELTLSALQLRAASRPGGEKFMAVDAKKAEIVAFLRGVSPLSVDVEASADGSLIDDSEDDENANPGTFTLPNAAEGHVFTIVASVDPDYKHDEVDVGGPSSPSSGLMGDELTVNIPPAPPPVDNNHIAEGAEPFSPEVIAANAPETIKESTPEG